MGQRHHAAAVLVVAWGTAAVLAQGPTFDVVSIKRNTAGVGPGPLTLPIQRPDGGFIIRNQSVRSFIGRAYPGMDDIFGLPEWASLERYDISATSTLTKATDDDRIAMMRAMLADRFQLKAHVEKRERDVFELVLARRDGKLGPGLTRSDADCGALVPPPQSTQRPDFTKPPPPCTMRMLGAVIRDREGDKNGRLGDVLEGTATMQGFAEALRNVGAAGRTVVDKTGLVGTYTIALNFDLRATMRPPSVDPPADAAPSVFTAVQEQLGLKLEPSKAQRDVLVIERLERPTPN